MKERMKPTGREDWIGRIGWFSFQTPFLDLFTLFGTGFNCRQLWFLVLEDFSQEVRLKARACVAGRYSLAVRFWTASLFGARVLFPVAPGQVT
jgi:hypothetical protein